MRMEKQIISELNRMREIMGLSLLLEIRLPAEMRKYMLDFLGFTEKQIDNIEKSADDFSDLSKLSDEFASKGVKTFDDLKSLVARDMRLGKVSDVSDEVILKWMKESPEIIQSITAKMNRLAAAQADSLIKKAEWQSIVGDDLAKTYEDFLNLKSIDGDDIILDAENASSVEIIANTYKSQIDSEIAAAERAGTPVPSSLRDLSRDMGEIAQQAKNLDEINRRDLSGVSGSKTKSPIEIENENLRLKKEELEKAKSELESVKKWIKGEQDYKDLSWMKGVIPNSYQKQVLNKIDSYLNDLISGKITLDELTKKAQTELESQMLKKENKMLKKQGTSLERFFQKNPKTVKYGVKATLAAGVLATIYYGGFAEYLKGAYENNKDVIVGSELDECFETVTGWSDLDSDVKSKFAGLGYSCLNRNKDEAPNEFITAVKYVPANPQTGTAEKFIITIGGQNKTILASGANTSSNTNTTTPNPSTTTYTNDPTGYKKYVEDKGGTYGTNGNYVMEDGTPFYKDANGNWQAGSYNGKTFVTN